MSISKFTPILHIWGNCFSGCSKLTTITIPSTNINQAKAENGIASCAVTCSFVIAKVGAQSIKVFVK